MRIEILATVQIIISFLIIISVLMQKRGSGAGSILGGSTIVSGGEYYRAKMGLEKFLTYFTILLATILVVTCFMYLFVE